MKEWFETEIDTPGFARSPMEILAKTERLAAMEALRAAVEVNPSHLGEQITVKARSGKSAPWQSFHLKARRIILVEEIQ